MPTLEEALAAYDRGIASGDDRARYGRAMLERALDASPELKANLERALAAGDIQSIQFENDLVAGAGGQYDPHTRTLGIPRGSCDSLADTVFVLGHETQHALSLQGRPAPYEAQLEHDVERIQAGRVRRGDTTPSTRIDPSDYTLPVYDYIEGTRREEAQAHIGGFNALVSHLTKQNNGDPPSLRQLYEALPGRMGDFIDTAGSAPRLEYRLKAGLTLADDGRLEPTEANIDAMKRHYADKFPGTFGRNGLLDYRHTALVGAWEHIHDAEQRVVDDWNKAHWHEQTEDAHLRSPPPTYGYRIDFEALGANPATLKFPHDGFVRVVDKSLEHAYLDDAGEREGAANPRRVAINNGFAPTRDAVRPRDDAQYMLREQGILPNEFLDAFRSSPNAEELTPNRVNHPAQLRAPAQSPLPLLPPLPQAPEALAGSPLARRDIEPALVAQARDALRHLEPSPFPPRSGLQERGEMLENMAAGLALEAQRAGLDRIDRICWNKSNDRLIALQGDPKAPDERHAVADPENIMNKPAAQSLSELSALARNGDALGHARREIAQDASITSADRDANAARPNVSTHSHQ